MELDDLLIQGADYAYTIHGWLKGVNSGALNTSRDMGGDAKSTGIRKLMGTDAFGFILHYYDGDYTQIGSGNSFIPTASTSGTGYNLVTENLYNGNIRAMTTALMRETHAKVDVVGAAYTYDQLNRLTGRKTFIKSNMHLSGNFTWSAISESPKWSSAYTYDGNGNLLTLERAGDNATSSYDMDDLTYNYYPNTNQLGRVDDAISSSAYSDDIDDQTGANYSYDEIGNLISDDQGDIDDIQWNVQGKITFIDKGSGPDLTFAYDAMGNRVMKMVDDGTEQVYTYYVRDAQGNIMTTYSRIDNGSTDSIFLGEQHIYGSGRLGYLSTRISMDSVLPTTGYYYRQLGLRRYELSNHLGNVLVVITDRRLLIEGTGGLAGKIVSAEPDVLQANDYYPFGMMMSGRTWSAGSSHRYGFQGQELENEVYNSGQTYSAEFWQYDGRLGRRWNVDPVVKISESPYVTFSDNPMLYIDPLGNSANPVYDEEGNFLGTDDRGLQGQALVMKKDDFNQGMKHEDALAKNIGTEGLKDGDAVVKQKAHFETLHTRPDYDGIVTREEGIAWAKEHPNLDDDGNPKNGFGIAKLNDYLYLDASKMDFGKLRKTDFIDMGSAEKIDLLYYVDLNSSNSISTSYALGRTYIRLISDENGGLVELPNGPWNGYDWSYGGDIKRDALIRTERELNGLNDTHGVPITIYGQGKLRIGKHNK